MPGSRKGYENLKVNAQQSEIFKNICKIPSSNRLKVFYLHLELLSDRQENKNGFAADRRLCLNSWAYSRVELLVGGSPGLTMLTGTFSHKLNPGHSTLDCFL